MTPDELVKKAAEAIADVWDMPEGEHDCFTTYARAAVSIALEEAANIAAPHAYLVSVAIRSLIPQDTQEPRT